MTVTEVAAPAADAPATVGTGRRRGVPCRREAWADWIGSAATVEREAAGDVARYRAELDGWYLGNGCLNTSRKAYRDWFPEYRLSLGSQIAALPSQEDRWYVIGECLMARGPLDAGLRALVNEGRVTGALIRRYGLTEDDVRDVAPGADYGYALRHGVELDADVMRPVEAFEQIYIADLLDTVSECEQDRDAAAEVVAASWRTAPARWGQAYYVEVGL